MSENDFVSVSGFWMWRDIQCVSVNSSHQCNDWNDYLDNSYNWWRRKYVQIDVLFQRSFNSRGL